MVSRYLSRSRIDDLKLHGQGRHLTVCLIYFLYSTFPTLITVSVGGS